MDDETGPWVAVSELARMRGVDKSAISRRVARLEGAGLVRPRVGKGGAKLINVAEFERATAETTDAVRALNGALGAASRPVEPLAPGDPVLAREQARRAAIEADLKQIELDRQRARMVPIEDVQREAESSTEIIIRAIEQLPSRAEDLAAAVGKDGVTGARAFLRAMVRDFRETVARALTTRADEEEQAAQP
jgi:DNA-binding MarR family transcriptional regulator